MSPYLHEWLESEKTGQWGALSQHTDTFSALFRHEVSSNNAAEVLVNDVLVSSDGSDAAWRFWNLLFHAAASFPEHVDALVRLTLAIRQVPPSPESPNKLTYSFWSYRRDAHSFYYTWRTLESSKSDLSPDGLTSAERWIHFAAFSAKLVQQGGERFMQECRIQAFFDVRNALETTLDSHVKTLLRNSIVSAEESLSADVEAAACWIIHAATELENLTNESFGSSWSKGLSKKTELWDGEPGFSNSRWKFWIQRFERLAKEDWMSESAKKAAEEAARVIQEVSQCSL